MTLFQLLLVPVLFSHHNPLTHVGHSDRCFTRRLDVDKLFSGVGVQVRVQGTDEQRRRGECGVRGRGWPHVADAVYKRTVVSIGGWLLCVWLVVCVCKSGVLVVLWWANTISVQTGNPRSTSSTVHGAPRFCNAENSSKLMLRLWLSPDSNPVQYMFQ